MKDSKPMARPANSAYARAREQITDDEIAHAEMMAALLSASPGDLRRLASTLKKRFNEKKWRRRMARRSAAVGVALRAARVALGDKFAGQEKTPHGWLVFATDDTGEKNLPAIKIVSDNAVSWREILQPVKLVVMREDLVNMNSLRRGMEKNKK